MLKFSSLRITAIKLSGEAALGVSLSRATHQWQCRMQVALESDPPRIGTLT
ncbi:MAG: hypothetical protein GY862_33635 [Gammaproteobacteria bacterium]|nr:hypothetical protein [Gammaproteobacteria bacterium]